MEFADDYFKSLMNHAIPMDERALKALSHNSVEMDIYAWVVQRLHRIDPNKPQFLSCFNLKEQFGNGYLDMYKFKQVFRKTLYMTMMQYLKAKLFEDKNKGYFLHTSQPLIPPKIISIAAVSNNRNQLIYYSEHVKFGRNHINPYLKFSIIVFIRTAMRLD